MTTHSAARLVGLLVLACALVPSAWAQQEPPAVGAVRGQVIDSESAAPLDGVKVTVTPSPGAGPDAPAEQQRVTDATGGFEFPEVPAGSYSIKFAKSGYRVSLMTSFSVKAGVENRADFPLPPLPPQATEEMPGFEEFVVEASPMEEILAASRMESDELLNTLNAAEFAKFAASDVADALKFVPGVNVVEGQFAIIRGLEDRYSSTLYNSAVVPSPDPDSQSVQLDLFPADIVTNLAVTKTFAPDLPSNSSGGSINILTNEYPESFEFKLSAGSGYNANAWDDFIEFEGGSPMGNPTDGDDTLESDFSMSLGGRGELAERELRFKLVGANEIDYDTAEGAVSGREPKGATSRGRNPPIYTSNGDLSFEHLSLSAGSFDTTVSEKSERLTGYLGFGFDIDTESRHKIDTTCFYTRAKDKAVQLYENGYIEGFNYSNLRANQQANPDFEINSRTFLDVATLYSWLTKTRPTLNDPNSRGPAWFSSFAESESFDVERDLVVYQVNGDHELDAVDGLHLSWAANTARTTQEETSLGTRYWYEPTDLSQISATFPATVDSLGPGLYYAGSGITSSENDIHERQDFARVDGDYQVAISPWLSMRFDAGYWYERADRDVDSNFLENTMVLGTSQFAIKGSTPQELGQAIFPGLDQDGGRPAGIVDTTNESSRDIQAWGVGSKATLWDDLDLFGGARFESISIESDNDPFTGEPNFDGTAGTFPTKYLFFDRLDNPAYDGIGRRPPPGTIFNDQILGIGVPVDPVTGFVDLTDEDIESLINGKIDEDRILPSAGFTYRAIEGMNLRGAYSQTVARPSFREMGYYISVEPGSDDLIIGNPQMQLSDVESFDARVEYVWGEQGDLGGVSGFYKTVEKPIESIIVRNPADFTSGGLYRTFFNNPNQAKLWGLELEGRKNLGFLGPELAQYFSIGGNYTYIWATVDRTETELARTRPFFGEVGQPVTIQSIDKSRRLYGQPEWIANVDLSFDHPDWGTKITLSFFAISDLLDAAGSAAIATDGQITSITLDRYLDSYSQLNLVASQSWPLRFIDGDVTLKGNVKNLTDSKRRVIYDQEATSSRIAEREFKVGLDYSISLTYSLTF